MEATRVSNENPKEKEKNIIIFIIFLYTMGYNYLNRTSQAYALLEYAQMGRSL